MNKDLKLEECELNEWSLDPDFTPNALVILLGCKLCLDNPILQNPTTLACGHTVCSTHLDDRQPVCPIQSCVPFDLSTKYPSISFVTTGPSPGSMDPIGSDVRLTQITSLALEHQHAVDEVLAHSSFAKELFQLLTCEICLNLLEEPTTTPCQHTFCLTCLQRSLDHSPNCPLCRHNFPDISIFNLYQPNAVLSAICDFFYYAAVGEPPDLPAVLSISPTNQLATPTLDPDHAPDTPIFVCQLSFPDMPTILHIFEPRYRLMLRRALKSENKQFGMIMYPAQDSVTINYGTMLRIQSVKILSDGRSVIETWGTHRFRIINRAERDGYTVGEIERIDDLPEAMERELERNATLYIPPRTPPVQRPLGRSPGPSTTELASLPPWITNATPVPTMLPRSDSPAPSIASLNSISTLSSTHSIPSSSAPPRLPGYDYPSEMSTDELAATCLAFIQRLRQGSSQLVIQRLNNVGPVPENKSVLSFWIAQLLPIDESEKSKLLPIRSPRLRLRLVVHWIDQFDAAWWFSGAGCLIA